MKKFIIIIVLILVSVSSVFSQFKNIHFTEKSESDFFSRFAIEAGVSKSFPIQNFAIVASSPTKYKLTGSLYAKIIRNTSAYFNYNYIGIAPNEDPTVNYVPRDNLYTFNVGINYSYDIKNHNPFVEGGIGLYSFTFFEPPDPGFPYKESTKTEFGANLGAGYRYLFDKRFGIFIKGKFHTFSYNSKNWSFWNISGGLYLKFH